MINDGHNLHQDPLFPDFITQNESKIIYALVKPELLIWGRQYAYLSLEQASQRIGIPIEKLRDWEQGISSPTINQLHILANAYHQIFAVFFLPSPPRPASLPLKDFRRLPDNKISFISPELALEIHTAIERREIAVRLAEESDQAPSEFPLSALINDSPIEISKNIRNILFPDISKLPSLSDKRIAFNFYRKKIEQLGILVFQASTVAVKEMRGFSICEPIFPVIVINRNDSHTGRIFSLFHELAHILLRIPGLCDIDPEISLPPESQKLEIFCNSVSAEILMPTENFLLNASIKLQTLYHNEFSDRFINCMSGIYGVSREAIVRKLLTLEFVTKEFYQIKREQYLREMEKKTDSGQSKGFITPPKQIISVAGKTYCGFVLEALNQNRITINDASGYLNVRIKHISSVTEMVGG